MAEHVIGYYAAEDPAVLAALEVQCCTNCGAVLWRRSKGSEPFPPWRRVGTDCDGTTTEAQPMAKRSRKKPEQADLPGTEDSAIKPLEAAAKRYAAIRDERIELNVEEAKLKAGLIVLMHKHGKTVYRRHNVEVSLVPEGESVKVKIKKAGDDEADDEGE